MSLKFTPSREDLWRRGDLLIATPSGPQQVSGYSYRGVGLHLDAKPLWMISHQATGHALIHIVADRAVRFVIATEIAECTDWTFSGLDGWKNMDPELDAKLGVIGKKYSRYLAVKPGRGGQNENVARQISQSRE